MSLRDTAPPPGPPPPVEDSPPPKSIEVMIDEAIEADQTLYARDIVDVRLVICRECDQFTGGNCRTMNRSCKTRLFWFWALVGFKGRFPPECEKWVLTKQEKNDDMCVSRRHQK